MNMDNIEYIIGIDNGVTGGLAILPLNRDSPVDFILSKQYVKKVRDYTKKEKNISRIDVKKLNQILQKYESKAIAILERPMINPTRFVASISASRSLEATLVVLESLNIDYIFCDSKEWQKYFFKNDIENTKILSKKYGKEFYPQYEKLIENQDADALLISLWAKSKLLKEGKIERLKK